MITDYNLNLTDLNQQQKDAVVKPIDTFVKITAGAGTGKTKIISKRFAKLVLDLQQQKIDNPIEKLLVITFTEKAAAEMKERIFKELKENSINYFGQENWISTIHGFCSKILRKHSIEAGLSPSFNLCDDKKSQEIFNNIITRISYREISLFPNIDKILKELNLDNTIFAINNLIKLNYAGKAENVINCIYNIIKKIKSLGLTPKEFLEQSLTAQKTFSNVVATLPFGFNTKEEYEIAWEHHLKPYADISCEFNQEVFDELYSDKIILDKNGKQKSQAWSQASGFPENIQEINSLEEYITKITAVIYALFQQELELNDLADFDDLINKTLYILNNNIILKTYYQKYFKHIIVDEFQDTNTAQMKLILSLLSQDKPNLTIVGDRKQSIYGFRFARMRNIDIIQKIIEKKYNKKYDTITLKNNYRSTPYILDVVNSVTQNELNLDETLVPNPNIQYYQTDEDIKISQIDGIKNKEEHAVLEAKFIANEIIRLTQNKDLNLKFKDFAVLVKGHGQADVIEKILTSYEIPAIKKVNKSYFKKDVVRNIIALFNFAKDIRNELFLVRILEIYCSQKELYDYKNALDKYIYKNINSNDAKKLNFAQKTLYIYENDSFNELNISDNTKEIIKKLYSTIFNITKNKKSLSLMSIFYKLTENIKPYSNLSVKQTNIAETDIMIFEKIIANYIKTQNFTNIRTFCEYIEEIKEDKNFTLPQVITDNLDAVQIMTIYAAKGLEFPYVFITHLKPPKKDFDDLISFELNEQESNSFGIVIHNYKYTESPKYKVYKAIYSAPIIKNEDLRLFYVALSRAKNYIHVLSFNKYTRIIPAEYVKNLELSFSQHLSVINPHEINIPKLNYQKLRIKQEKKLTAPKVSNISENTFEMSFSKINTFNQCPRKFINKYEYKYPALTCQKENSIAGSIIHNFICNSFINKKIMTNEEINKTFEQLSLSMEDVTKIKSTMKTFYNYYFPYQKNKEFFPEYSFEFKLGNMIFNGDIDLIIKNEDNSLEIVDFKTNRQIEPHLREYHKQMHIYRAALLNKNLKVKQTKIIHLQPDKIKEYILSDTDLETAQKELNKDIQNINLVLTHHEKAIQNKKYCKNCEFSYLCND